MPPTDTVRKHVMRISDRLPRGELATRVTSLRQLLAELRGRMAWCVEEADSSDLTAAVADLFELVRSYDDEEAYAVLERLGEVAYYRAVFSPLVLDFIAATERRTAAELVTLDDVEPRAIERALRSNPWGAYAAMEATLRSLDVSRRRRCAVVGCGPLPDSLLCLRHHTDLETLVGIERDPAASSQAQKLVDALELDRLRLLEADGAAIDYGPFDFICVSVFAVPRAAILEQIARTAPEGACVVLRDPFFTGTLLFEPVLGALPRTLHVRAEVPSAPGRLMLRRYILECERKGASTSA